MKRTTALFLLANTALWAAEYRVELKPENTKVAWTLSDVLHTVHGTFVLKQGRVEFDTQSGKVTGQAVVDVLSGDSGSEARDKKMHAKVLESVQFPEAIFTPDRMEGTVAVPGSSTCKLHGMFSLHGAVHEMTMDVQTNATADHINITMSFDVPYVAWGLKDPSTFVLKVGKSVHVSIETSGALVKR
jgi:polyisoprenoid-binding protein YceI